MTKRIWIIDGSYLYKSTPERFDYLRLKNELQTILGITFTESYYFNSRMPRSTPAQLSFNKWLQTAEPIGPQLIVKLFDVKRIFPAVTNANNNRNATFRKAWMSVLSHKYSNC